MALQRGLKLPTLIDGSAQITLESVSVEIDGQVTDLVSMIDGLVGFNYGAKSINISFNNYINTGGIEFDFVAAIANESSHTVQVVLGGKQLSLEGVFTSGSISGASGETSKSAMSFRAPFDNLT